MPDRDSPITPTTSGFELPVTEVLTGRGAVFGKSGSGKSNTVTVVLEELLERDLGFLVVDPDGEYYGLKESYEVVRAGNGEGCDVQVGPEDAESLARLALDEEVPVILDLSGYLDGDVVDRLVGSVLTHLFHLENDRRQPYLVVLEEAHEYIPQSGRSDDLAETVIRVAKRGRKRGLGILGVSQRPAAVDKDFITQCNWLVWHRLTWANDVDVVRKHLDSTYADRIGSLDAGEAFVVGDWAEGVREVRFRRKRTFDAGATPGFESVEAPALEPVSPALLRSFGRGEGHGDGIGADTDPRRAASATEASTVDDADDSGTEASDPADGSGSPATHDPAPGGSRTERPGGTGARRNDVFWETGHLLTYLLRSAIGGARRLLRGTSEWAAQRMRAVRADLGERIDARADGVSGVSPSRELVAAVLLAVLLVVAILLTA